MPSSAADRHTLRRHDRRGSLAAVAGLVAIAAIAAILFDLLATDGAFATGDASDGPRAAAAVTGGSVEAGRARYLQSCASCHGGHAEGTEVAPPLTHSGTALVDLMLRTGRMPLPETGQPIRRGRPVLDEAAIDDVVAYLATVTDGPAIPAGVRSGSAVGQGRRLFMANCAACHGAAGAGAAIGGNAFAPSLAQSEPIDVGEAVVGGPPPMPRFSFSPDELDAIAGYVQYLRTPPQPGGSRVAALGPVAEGAIALLVGLVAVLVLTRWVGRSDPREQAHPRPADEEPGGEAPG